MDCDVGGGGLCVSVAVAVVAADGDLRRFGVVAGACWTQKRTCMQAKKNLVKVQRINDVSVK